MMYENMRDRVENVVKRGSINHDYITNEEESEALSRWTDAFTPRNHPAVIQVYFPGTSHQLWNNCYIYIYYGRIYESS